MTIVSSPFVSVMARVSPSAGSWCRIAGSIQPASACQAPSAKLTMPI
jgi:hypothetical protein